MKITITQKGGRQDGLDGVTRVTYSKGGLLQVYTGGVLPAYDGDFSSFDLGEPESRASVLASLPDRGEGKKMKTFQPGY